AIRTASRLNSSLCPFAIVQGNIALKGPELNWDKSNEPLNVAHSPMAPAKLQFALNCKQRKAMEAR
ncbi:hypothetical protein SAMN04488527_14915, partial [Aliiroseovarius crassostreae]